MGRGASPGLTLVHIAGQAVRQAALMQCRGSAIAGTSRRAALRPRAPACTGRATWDARPAARGGGGRRAGGGGGRGAAADQRAWIARTSSGAAPLQGFAPHRFAIGIEAVHKSRVENQKAEKRAPMNHISVIVWALCMLQSVSAFAPEPSSDEITPSLGSSFSLPTLGSSPEFFPYPRISLIRALGDFMRVRA